MRAGHRLASLEVLMAISQAYDVEMPELLAAVTKGNRGDRSEWVALLARIFDDGEPDPDEGLDEPTESAGTDPDPLFSHAHA